MDRENHEMTGTKQQEATDPILTGAVAELFEPFGLDASSQEEIAKYCRYLERKLGSEEQIAYNFYIHCSDDRKAVDFSDALKNLVKIYRSSTPEMVRFTEDELYSQKEKVFAAIQSSDIMVMHECMDAGKVEKFDADMAKTWDEFVNLCDKNPQICKVICAVDETALKRFIRQDHLYYRIFSHHIHLLKKPIEHVVDYEIGEILKEKGFKLSDKFQKGLKEYLNVVYPKADLKGQPFVEDMCRRILDLYYTSSRKDMILDEGMIPLYRKEIADAEDYDGIENILLLAMSTLNTKDPIKCVGNQYDNLVDYVEGYGQLEPVPKLLIKKKKTPLLILIMASKSSMSKVNFETEDKENGIKKWKNCSAVDFFKVQISDYKPEENTAPDVRFKVIETENKPIIEAVKDVVDIIRRIREQRNDARLYLDMHGGRREDQLVVDAIINLLRIENIDIEEAFSIAGAGKEIKNVNENLRIFDFVAGIEEFVNYGYGNKLIAYVNRQQRGQQGIKWRERLSRKIKAVSEALSLCQVKEFDESLDELGNVIKEEHAIDPLFEIFIKNIEKDYGLLLEGENCSLYEKVKWAMEKGFYQQCLAIIEAKTPEYVMENLFENEPYKIERTKITMTSKKQRNRFTEISYTEGNYEPSDLDRLLREKPQAWKQNVNFYMETMTLYWSEDGIKSHWEVPKEVSDSDGKVGIFTYLGSNVDTKWEEEGTIKIITKFKYKLYYKKRWDFSFEQFVILGESWRKLKDIRNNIFHVNENIPVDLHELKNDMKRYLDKLFVCRRLIVH